MTEVPADGGPPLGHGASLGTDAFPTKGSLRFPEGIDLEMIDSLAPANNTQVISHTNKEKQESSAKRVGQIPSKLPKWNMDQWESTNGSMKDGSTEIGFDIDDQSMKSTFWASV